MRIRQRAVWLPAAAVLLAVAACGGSGGGAVTSQPAPSGAAAPPSADSSPPSPDSPLPPADSPPPAEGSPATPPADGGSADRDLADTLPSVSTMPESSAPLPSEEDIPTGEHPEGIEGVVAVPVINADHVRYDVDYPTAPPAGGPHLGAWLNCGFYTVPVLDELAVHSLEHGAVWVTYRSDVAAGGLDELAARSADEPHLLVSPYEGQDSPVVLTAWARQLSLESLDDSRFERFLEVYLVNGPTTPEPGAACSGAVGVPPDAPEAVPQQG